MEPQKPPIRHPGQRWAILSPYPQRPPCLIEKGPAQATSQKVLVVAFCSQAGSILAIRLHSPWHKSLLAARVVVLR